MSGVAGAAGAIEARMPFLVACVLGFMGSTFSTDSAIHVSGCTSSSHDERDG